MSKEKKHGKGLLAIMFAAIMLLATGCTEKEKVDNYWVDLGLPSGLLWATRNVGASSPEDYGDYFAWGETSPKEIYDWRTYRYCNGSMYALIKYCSEDVVYCNHGFGDTLTILQTGDDAATANYGGRTPTEEEWWELRNNTTVQRTTQNGVKGLCFTGTNGNSLFLPAAGYRADSSLYNVGFHCFYWSSSLDTYWFTDALAFTTNDGYLCTTGHFYRCSGFSIRAVRRN